MKTLLAFASLGLVLSGVTADAQTAESCAAGLVPNLTLQTSQQSVKYAWLDLITKENYASAKTAAATSGDVEITDLFKIGDASASYEQFHTNYEKFKEEHTGSYQKDEAVSLVSSQVPDSARTDYFNCVRNSKGLHVYMQEQRADSAIVVVSFAGEPGSSVRYSAEISNGTRVPPQSAWSLDYWLGTKLQTTASDTFKVTRDGSKDISVIVKAQGMSDHAVSVVPPLPLPPPPPQSGVNAQGHFGELCREWRWRDGQYDRGDA
jgi:hypothetical protein